MRCEKARRGGPSRRTQQSVRHTKFERAITKTEAMDTTELDAAWASLSQPCGLPPSLQEAAKRARGQRFGVAAAAFARATAVAEPLRLSDVRNLPSVSDIAAKAPKKPAPLPGGSSLAALMGTKEEEPPKRRSFGDVPDRRRQPPQRARPRAPRYGPPQYSDEEDEPPPPSRGGFRAAGGGQRRGFRVPRARSASPQPGSGQQQQKKQKKQEEKKEEEEELPERLKGCDKELVKRIEQEVIDSGSPVTFEDVAGLADAKRSIQEMVIWPMQRPELFTGLRAVPKGMLLFGPPGTGKTLIGRAIASSSGATFFSISASSLMSKWIGESEKLVRTMFAVAGHKEPSVVFIDEVDSLLSQRNSNENEASRRLKTEFLVQLEGVGSGDASNKERVLVVGATNRPQELDEAARRRFVKRFYVPLPDDDARTTLLKTLLAKNRHCLTEADIEGYLVPKTDGFSGADMRNLCQEAAMGPMRDVGSKLFAAGGSIDESQIPPISLKHFDAALAVTAATVAQSDLEQYEAWNATFGSARPA